ncbi:ATP-binding protein [Sphingobium quisquiliarum P25]|uniref:ATP-binding protein n=1 Tax=Sphingobium quisquiliarum P25 TaxID=1329909 RepID=T0GZD8_9SPHN|nr:type I secretion system permease/ATPase [Sphingobium quisquiliarum]EQB05303.1 ATP-binding protein [Sphingobium quisquiliarum P25]
MLERSTLSLSEWLDRQGMAGDELSQCIAHVARHFGRAPGIVALRAGLAVDESGRLPFHQAESALDQIGLLSDPVRGRLDKWRPGNLPAILPLAGGRFLLLLDIREGDALVQLPHASEPIWTPLGGLEPVFTGEALAVMADHGRERAEERPWDERARQHWFWREVWRARGAFGYVMLAAGIINLLAFALPLFTMNVYDRIIPNKAASSLWVLGAGVMLAFALDFALRLARARLVDEAGREIDERLSQRLFEKVMNVPLASRAGSTGALARRVSEFESVREFFTSTTVVLVVDIAFLFLFVGVIALLGGWLAAVPVVMIGVMGTAGFFLQRSMAGLSRDAQADASLQSAALVEAIGGIETLKACRAEGRMLERWRRYARMSAMTQEKLRRLSSASVTLASLCQQVTSIALVIGGFYMFAAGEISMGAIIAIVMLAGRSLAPVGQLAFVIVRARQALTTLASLQTLIDQPDERLDGARGIIPKVRKGAIAARALAFSYPGATQPSLKGIDLRIEPGERIGIIGRVASGKSTLGRVLCGLYPPSGGMLAIDDVDSRQYHPHELRSAFRYVGQDAELFSGSVRENLLLGARDADDARLLEALERSGASRFFGRDAAGFDLHIGERGSRLSGGQRSFLVLARALVEPARLLFLDEPTGAMDNQTENLFVDHLAKALDPDQTLIVSTHRHALLRIVERLIVIDQGMVIADGPRDEIIGQSQKGAA